MTAASTLHALLDFGMPAALAVRAPGGLPLNFAGLRSQINNTVSTLNAIGIGITDKVGIILPNGPEMATAFLSIATGMIAAPLNPAYRADEFEFYLTDLNAKALVVAAGLEGPAVDIAMKLQIPVIRLLPTPEIGTGRFSLDLAGVPASIGVSSVRAQPNDVALVLYTSGTTSRPKMVPLTHANLTASANNIARTLKLTSSDCGLVIMPLFHVHGLVAGVLAALAAGGTVFCAPGFSAINFFAWVEEARPTWYTAVPTMHQAILCRAAKHRQAIGSNPLRLIRSSSSALPPQVLAELEHVFNTHVIEAYGMTEAAHQIASNPLPPGDRQPGSVGVAAGPEIEIMDSLGNILERGQTGEIVIRGENVIVGYENNPEANTEAFINGWFRTGDQGVIDANGFLRINGRLKEIINRGAEKINPIEIDEVLRDHPAVQQVVTFAVSHRMLGEEVGAAVVVREGHVLAEQALRDFAAQRLASFKVPRKIVFLNEIPKGQTGKIQRIGLAQKLGVSTA